MEKKRKKGHDRQEGGTQIKRDNKRIKESRTEKRGRDSNTEMRSKREKVEDK